MSGTIICYGDSNTYGFDPRAFVGEQYPEKARWTDLLAKKTEWKVQNHGMNGRCIPHSTAQVDFVCGQLEGWRKEKQPIWLWVMLGTNDLLMNDTFTAEDVASRMEAFLQKLLKQEAVLQGEIKLRLIAPAKLQYGAWVSEERIHRESRKLGEEYRKVAEHLEIAFTDAGQWGIPVAFDGVHFTEEGHRILAGKLAKVIA